MALHSVAIMQPTYLPWLGYFDLIDQSDCFVFLDSVQFSKRSWQQRNRVKGPGNKSFWLTVPVQSKGRRNQDINEVTIDDTKSLEELHVQTITHFYRKAPYFSSYIDELKAILCRPYRLLVELNIDLITWLCTQIGIGGEMILSSSLNCDGTNVQRLVSICKKLEADRYISAPGSRDYIGDDELFLLNDIELTYHSYYHPEYRQFQGSFVPYLSTLDLLFNEGPAALDIIRKGRCGLTSNFNISSNDI